MAYWIQRRTTILAASILVATACFGGELIVEQRDKTFVANGAKVTALKIKVGDVIHFKNMDPFFHNVFSLSDAKLFDLGSYPQGQARSVTFDKAGTMEVECAIHPQMKLTVEVK